MVGFSNFFSSFLFVKPGHLLNYTRLFFKSELPATDYPITIGLEMVILVKWWVGPIESQQRTTLMDMWAAEMPQSRCLHTTSRVFSSSGILEEHLFRWHWTTPSFCWVLESSNLLKTWVFLFTYTCDYFFFSQNPWQKTYNIQGSKTVNIWLATSCISKRGTYCTYNSMYLFLICFFLIIINANMLWEIRVSYTRHW